MIKCRPTYMFLGSFNDLHESLQPVEAGDAQDNLLFSQGRKRVICGLIQAMKFGSLIEDNFCKRRKPSQNCRLLVI